MRSASSTLAAKSSLARGNCFVYRATQEGRLVNIRERVRELNPEALEMDVKKLKKHFFTVAETETVSIDGTSVTRERQISSHHIHMKNARWKWLVQIPSIKQVTRWKGMYVNDVVGC